MIETTNVSQYNACIQVCKAVFEQKNKDYGTAWRILRLPSITDQIMIKAQRIRSIEQTGKQLIPEGIQMELVGIINYSIIALLQLSLPDDAPLTLPYHTLSPLYDTMVQAACALCHQKDHDYQQAWKAMRISSLIDIILMKLLRIKNIEDQQNQTHLSEGVTTHYQDIINYAVFASIKQQAIDQPQNTPPSSCSVKP